MKSSHIEAMEAAANMLQQSQKDFDWVGFYIMNNEAKTLHLGPFVGAETDHIVIPFGKGICGQVAVLGEVYHSDDVQSEDNYIACSLDTQSELVLPVYSTNGELVAQLDIDSHVKGTFDAETIAVCERVCMEIGSLWPNG